MYIVCVFVVDSEKFVMSNLDCLVAATILTKSQHNDQQPPSTTREVKLLQETVTSSNQSQEVKKWTNIYDNRHAIKTFKQLRAKYQKLESIYSSNQTNKRKYLMRHMWIQMGFTDKDSIKYLAMLDKLVDDPNSLNYIPENTFNCIWYFYDQNKDILRKRIIECSFVPTIQSTLLNSTNTSKLNLRIRKKRTILDVVTNYNRDSVIKEIEPNSSVKKSKLTQTTSEIDPNCNCQIKSLTEELKTSSDTITELKKRLAVAEGRLDLINTLLS